MHNIKEIRNDPKNFKQKILNRNSKVNIDDLLSLDKKYRELIQKKETLEQEKKTISKKKDKNLFVRSKEITTQLEELEIQNTKFKSEIDIVLSNLPNIALEDVPVGPNESSNKEILKFGSINKFDFKPSSHYDLGKKLNLMDFDLASKTSGSRFVFLKGQLALLERALSNFMLDIHTQKFGYQEVSPPLIANDISMFGTGQLPKFENDQFELKLIEEKSKKYLIPTAEVILTNMVRDSFVNDKLLPLRFVASTSCFRKEAGSYGKDTKGMIRQHQFYKVELVSIVDPKECKNELERMLKCAQEILKILKIPYRILLLSTGDMGFSSEKTYDIEAWMPSENKYREISSCSSCGQFQSRRMKTRYKNKMNETNFVGTLNGSGLAIGRTLIAIMENYQQKDGSISIPKPLIPYMQGQEKIG